MRSLSTLWGLVCRLACCCGLIGYGLVSIPMALAKEDRSKDEVTVRKTEEGLRFNLPPDWPVEKRGGVMAPIPIEEYLARKFKVIESRLQILEQRLNGLDVRLRVQEEAMKKSNQGMRATESSVSPTKE